MFRKKAVHFFPHIFSHFWTNFAKLSSVRPSNAGNCGTRADDRTVEATAATNSARSRFDESPLAARRRRCIVISCVDAHCHGNRQVRRRVRAAGRATTATATTSRPTSWSNRTRAISASCRAATWRASATPPRTPISTAFCMSSRSVIGPVSK